MGKNLSRQIRIYQRLGILLMVFLYVFVCLGPVCADEEKTYKSLKVFVEVLEELEKRYVDEVDPQTLIENAIKGMVENLDPHSSFMPPESFESLQDDTKGKFSGVGIVITLKDGIITVVSPIEDTPAHKAGVLAGDAIIKINEKSTKGMALWEAVSMMRGPRFEPVTLTIFRINEPAPLTFELKRDLIPMTSVRYAMLKPGYGYLRITNFRMNTAEDVEKYLTRMEDSARELKGLVIDLRDNPGGLLDQAVKISDLFLDNGTIVSIKGRTEEQVQTFTATSKRPLRNYPIVVLINGGSASASEIVAGALKDNGRALILGTTSFGKGSVQTVHPLNDGFGLKYTIARYYTPGGHSIQARGIVPDIEVPYRLVEKPGKTTAAFEGMFKERDLQNSLSPEKTETDKAASGQVSKKQKSRKKQKGMKMDGKILNRETLMRDAQIIRALDALVTYRVFTKRNGN